MESLRELIGELKAEGAEVSLTGPGQEVQDWLGNPAQLVYVAVEDSGRVLAMVKGRRELTPEKAHAAFLTAATRASARGLGLAARLTGHALEAMQAHGVTLARIYVYSDNEASLKAVAKLGFTHTGTVLRHHRDPATGAYVDDLIFHKVLD